MENCIREPRSKWYYRLERAWWWVRALTRVPWYPLRVLVHARRCRRGEHEGFFGTCDWCGVDRGFSITTPLVRRFWPPLVFQELVPSITEKPLAAEGQIAGWKLYTLDVTYTPPPRWRRALSAVRGALVRWSR